MTAEANTRGEFQFGKEVFDCVDRIVEISRCPGSFTKTSMN
jgi:hypothetical protein